CFASWHICLLLTSTSNPEGLSFPLLLYRQLFTVFPLQHLMSLAGESGLLPSIRLDEICPESLLSFSLSLHSRQLRNKVDRLSQHLAPAGEAFVNYIRSKVEGKKMKGKERDQNLHRIVLA